MDTLSFSVTPSLKHDRFFPRIPSLCRSQHIPAYYSSVLNALLPSSLPRSCSPTMYARIASFAIAAGFVAGVSAQTLPTSASDFDLRLVDAHYNAAGYNGDFFLVWLSPPRVLRCLHSLREYPDEPGVNECFEPSRVGQTTD
jgi:hypothetical protein